MRFLTKKRTLLAFILCGATSTLGCSTDWLRSPSAEYAKPGELSQDVESLPDPNVPVPRRSDATSFRNSTGAAHSSSSSQDSPERLLSRADALFEQGKFHDAALKYKKYLAASGVATASPEILARAHYRLGVVARKKMSFREAKSEFETALQFSPQNAEYRFALGKTCYDSTDYAAADAAFSALIATAPDYPEAQYFYGLTLLEGTRRAEAVKPLTAAVGELRANALLTNKYYELGESALAAQAEAQTEQIATRLGQPLPAFPNKPAFAPTQFVQTPQTPQLEIASQFPALSEFSQIQPENATKIADATQIPPQIQTENATKIADSTQIPPQIQTENATKIADSTQIPPQIQTENATEIADSTQIPPQIQTENATEIADSTQIPPQIQTENATKIADASPIVPSNEANATLGRRNPGLFATFSATIRDDEFRPGSLANVGSQNPATNPIASENQLALSDASPLNTTNSTEPLDSDSRRFTFNGADAFRYVEVFNALEFYVAFFENAPTPETTLAQVAESAENSNFSEEDDFAFASSGVSSGVSSNATTSNAASESVPQPLSTNSTGSFADYNGPSVVATPPKSAGTAPQYVALTVSTPSVSSPAQAIQLVQPTPSTSQNSQEIASPEGFAVSNSRRSTPEERLQAARNAGAEVSELTPEQYRRAVSVGLARQPSNQ